MILWDPFRPKVRDPTCQKSLISSHSYVLLSLIVGGLINGLGSPHDWSRMIFVKHILIEVWWWTIAKKKQVRTDDNRLKTSHQRKIIFWHFRMVWNKICTVYVMEQHCKYWEFWTWKTQRPEKPDDLLCLLIGGGYIIDWGGSKLCYTLQELNELLIN